MSERVTMPALGESVTEGTVTRWLKSVGDEVAVDEPLLEVSTDKVDTEIPSPVAGTLTEILVQEDETVPVGADLCVIGDAAEGGGGGGGEDDAQAPAQDAPAAQPQAGDAPQGAEEQPETAAQQEPETTAPDGDAGAESGGGSSQGGGSEQGGGSPGGGSVEGGTTVTMPALGESVTEGTVTRWLKSEGDQVEVDEPLLEVSTDKVDTEIPSPAAGTLTKILVGEDETVPVGAELAIIGGSVSGGGADGGAESAPPQESAPAQQESGGGAEQSTPSEEAATAAAAEDPQPSTESEAPKGESAAGSPPPTEAPAEASSQAAEDAAQAAPVAQATAPAPAPEPSTPEGDAGAGDAAQGDGEKGDGETDASAYVTPLVRKLASEGGVDLESITGTGIGGRIRKQDVLDAIEKAKQPAAAAATSDAAAPEAAQSAAPSASAAASQAKPSAPSTDTSGKRGTREKMSRLRKIIAQRMVESLQVSAQLTTVVEVDMSTVAALRTKAKGDFEAREGTKLSFLPFIALATCEALKSHPGINASVEGEEIVYHGSENLAIAVDTPRGLLVPVVKNAGDLNIAGLARAIADVAARTRDNKITPDDLAGGTFTITNTGSRGALFDTPILNQPQVAMLGTGAIVRRPVVVDVDGAEGIAIRSMMFLALSYDHRVVDGADAARFLVTIKDRLEEGNFEGSLGS